MPVPVNRCPKPSQPILDCQPFTAGWNNRAREVSFRRRREYLNPVGEKTSGRIKLLAVKPVADPIGIWRQLRLEEKANLLSVLARCPHCRKSWPGSLVRAIVFGRPPMTLTLLLDEPEMGAKDMGDIGIRRS